MLIGDARDLVKLFARNAGDTTFYPDTMVDTAMQAAADELIMRANLLPRIDSVAVASAATTVSGFPANFRPDRISSVYLTGDNVRVCMGATSPTAWKYVEGGRSGVPSEPSSATLDIVDFNTILDYQISLATTGQPQAIGFQSWTTAALYPIPDDAYTLKVRWFDFFTTWTAGDSGADDLTLNLPDDLLRQVLLYGAPAFLQHNDPEHAYATVSGRKFSEFIDRLVGSAGGLGTASVVPRRRRR
jgi:hypothetical protein